MCNEWTICNVHNTRVCVCAVDDDFVIIKYNALMIHQWWILEASLGTCHWLLLVCPKNNYNREMLCASWLPQYAVWAFHLEFECKYRPNTKHWIHYFFDIISSSMWPLTFPALYFHNFIEYQWTRLCRVQILTHFNEPLDTQLHPETSRLLFKIEVNLADGWK